MRLSWEKVAELALEAGWNKEEAVTAVAIARAESSFSTTAVSSANAVGLWQIHVPAHRDKFNKRTDLFIPTKNAAIAYRIYEDRLNRTGQAWVDWDAFRFGRHKKHMQRAKRAVEKVYKGQDAPLHKYDPERWLEEKNIPYVSDALGTDPEKVGPDVEGAILKGVEALWPVLLNGALTATGLALIAYGLVKGLGASGRTKEVVTKGAPVAAGVSK